MWRFGLYCAASSLHQLSVCNDLHYGLHIAYSDRDSTREFSENVRLWIVDIVSGEASEIAMGFAPSVSPDGRRIAFLHGSWFGDACFVGFGLGVVELDDQLQVVSLLTQEEINGIPLSEDESFFPLLTPELEFPGVWQNEIMLEIGLRCTCTDDSANGVYLIDTESSEAQKIANLPPE